MEVEDFLGRWKITRQIEDRMGQGARFLGEARIEESPDIWRYHEQGQMTLLDGATFVSGRAYLWQPSGTGFDLFFEDGRPFHRMELNGGSDIHWCNPDTYAVTYHFGGWPNWMARWEVEGPRKNYTMTSYFSPLASP